MSTQKIICLAVELKVCLASDADHNSFRRPLSLPHKKRLLFARLPPE
jgi:hypothetical protein